MCSQQLATEAGLIYRPEQKQNTEKSTGRKLKTEADKLRSNSTDQM